MIKFSNVETILLYHSLVMLIKKPNISTQLSRTVVFTQNFVVHMSNMFEVLG